MHGASYAGRICKGVEVIDLPTFLLVLLVALVPLVGKGQPAETPSPGPLILLPQQALAANQLAVIVNDRDPMSRRIARYYAAKRRIPAENLIHVRFSPGSSVMDGDLFQRLYAQVRAATPPRVQAYALTWAAPYRVGCMSITTAFAAGYDDAFCAVGCKPTRESPYFASDSQQPFTDLGWRPTMALAGERFADVKALIDRGVASDGTRPPGTGYLVNTSDRARSVRAVTFDDTIRLLGRAVKLERVDADYIARRPDVLFYITGTTWVPRLATNRFRPGAIGDHLTSTGGELTDSHQMSSLRWLEAGATGSYGSVVEPCNLLTKFPTPPVLIASYLSGATLIEAYWKSVEMPGQGIFIGEPLAHPFGGYEVTRAGGRWVVKTYALRPGHYQLQDAEAPVGPYRAVGAFDKPGFEPLRLVLPEDTQPYYRVVPFH
jgi:uncharacterized protein (TIGR03790 family)